MIDIAQATPWDAHWLEQRRREAERPLWEHLSWLEQATITAEQLAHGRIVEPPDWAKAPPPKP